MDGDANDARVRQGQAPTLATRVVGIHTSLPWPRLARSRTLTHSLTCLEMLSSKAPRGRLSRQERRVTRAEARRGDPGAFAAATAVMPEHSDRSRDVPRPSDIRSGVARAEELDSPEQPPCEPERHRSRPERLHTGHWPYGRAHLPLKPIRERTNSQSTIFTGWVCHGQETRRAPCRRPWVRQEGPDTCSQSGV